MISIPIIIATTAISLSLIFAVKIVRYEFYEESGISDIAWSLAKAFGVMALIVGVSITLVLICLACCPCWRSAISSSKIGCCYFVASVCQLVLLFLIRAYTTDADICVAATVIWFIAALASCYFDVGMI